MPLMLGRERMTGSGQSVTDSKPSVRIRGPVSLEVSEDSSPLARWQEELKTKHGTSL